MNSAVYTPREREREREEGEKTRWPLELTLLRWDPFILS